MTLPGADATGAARGRPDRRGGRAGPRRRAHRVGQVDPARRDVRPGPALHRRHPHRPRAPPRPRHPRPPPARPRRPRRCRRAGPARRVRHRHRRGGARLRHGAARPARGDDAQAGRGDPRPARHRRAARRRRCASCPAASSSGSPSGRCSPPTRGSSCSTSRRRRSTRPAPRRCSRRSPGSSTTSRSPSSWPSTGSSGCCTTPTRSCTSRPTARCGRDCPSELMVDSDIASPVVELGRYAGWSPLPLSVRDARRAAVGLRARLAATLPPGHDRPTGRGSPTADVVLSGAGRRRAATPATWSPSPGSTSTCTPGEVTAVMGRNGCGKSSLLWALQGSGTPDLRHGPGHPGLRNGRTEHTSVRENGVRSWGSSRRPRPTCSTSTPSAPSATRPTARAALPRGTCAELLDRRRARHPRRTSTPATSPRARSSPSCSPCSSPPTRRCCCSTSRPAAWTPRPRRR